MNFFFKQKNKKRTGGFTLIETLVAISIFSMSILSMMVLLGKGIADTSYAKNKIIATYLAQEGVEYLRNMRDTFVLYDSSGAQNGWNAFQVKISPCDITTDPTQSCYFNDQNLIYNDPIQPMTGIAINTCSGTCPQFLYDSATGRYNYASGVNSGFIRKTQVTQVSPNETKILSTVYWTQALSTYQVTFSENLFNWIE